MYVRTLVCLANSRKPGGRCVAGKDVTGDKVGSWIRPVSAREGGELQLTERWYGKPQYEVQVGHVFHIGLLSHHPHPYQVENHLINLKLHLGYDSTAKYNQILQLVDSCNGPLWINGHSTKHGSNDYIPVAIAPQLGESLKLLKVDDLTISVSRTTYEGKEKIAVRGIFRLNGYRYALKITDPVIEQKYITVGDGMHSVGEAIICVSLGEPFQDNAYKLIASVITKGS